MGGVDDGALAGLARTQDPREKADGEVQRAAANVADQRRRRRRRIPGRARDPGGAAQRDIVEVMAGGLRERAVLPPTGQPSVDQLPVAREHGLRSEAEPLHDAWTHPLNQRVGVAGDVEGELRPCFSFEIERDRALAAFEDRRRTMTPRRRVLALNEDNVRAEIGQQHPAKWTRPNALELHNSDARQDAHIPPLYAYFLVIIGPQIAGFGAKMKNAHSNPQVLNRPYSAACSRPCSCMSMTPPLKTKPSTPGT